MKEVKKSGKGRKRKRDSSSHGESATKRASLDTIRTAVALQVRLAGEEASSPQSAAVPVSSKDKEKTGESAAAPESHIAEV